jgi:hypothetical protein
LSRSRRITGYLGAISDVGVLPVKMLGSIDAVRVCHDT